MCRELKRITRALLSEYHLPMRAWVSVIPIVQSALNNAKIRRLGNRAPVTVFTGLEPQTPLSLIKRGDSTTPEWVGIQNVAEKQRKSVESFVGAIDDMHKDVRSRADAARRSRRKSHDRRKGVNACNFDIGDFVLRGAVRKGTGRKMAIHWNGTHRVMRILSDHLYELENLISGKRETVHGSRIQFFRNSELEVGQDLRNYLRYQQGQYCIVEKFLDLRASESGPQVLVEYAGFSDEEPLWMPLREMREDVPELLNEFLEWIQVEGTPRQKQILLRC